MKEMYHSKDTCMFLINYHLIWRPKRRCKILLNALRTRLDELICQTAPALECEILALDILADHLHLFVSATPYWAPNQIVTRFKAKTSCIFREEFPFLQRMSSLWTRSYFCSTADHISADTIRRYIEAQSIRD